MNKRLLPGFFKRTFVRALISRTVLGMALFGIFGMEAIQAPVHEVRHEAQAQTEQMQHPSKEAIRSVESCALCDLALNHTITLTSVAIPIRLRSPVSYLEPACIQKATLPQIHASRPRAPPQAIPSL
jgi:hypothetical protein